MVMIVRTPPDTARAQREDTKDFHDHPRHAGSRQNGLVLLIVINDEEPQEQQSAQNAANDLKRGIAGPKSPSRCNREEKRCGKDAPPTFESEVFCVRPGGEDQCLAGSHAFRAR